MTPRLDQLLFERWPELYRRRHWPLSESAIASGFQHEDGWFALVDVVSAFLTLDAHESGREVAEATQVKEKLGGLRFYAHNTSEHDRGAIALAELFSYRICEISGLPGRLAIRDRRYETLSPWIAEERGFKFTSRSYAPPLELAEISANLGSRWHTTLIEAVALPSGWADLADCLLQCIVLGFSHARPSDARVRLVRNGNVLEVSYDGATDSTHQGIAAFATAMSERLDPATGATRIEAETRRLSAVSERGQLRRITELLGGEPMLRRPVERLLDAHALLLEGLPRDPVNHLIGNLELLRGNESLARAIRINARVTRSPRERLSPDHSARVWLFVEALAAATDVFGSQAEAERWLERPAYGLEQRCPLDLLATPAGFKLVHQYLRRIYNGVYT